MDREGIASETDADVEVLADSWPRPLIALGGGESLARWWCESRRAASTSGRPPFPRHPLSPALAKVLFEARRARRLTRGLEDAAKSLDAQRSGLEKAPATQVGADRRRISRLLLLSQDAAPRFYREVEKICRRHATRLEALVLECDETELARSVFGPGRVARAVLLDHKEAVVDFLATLETEIARAPTSRGDSGSRRGGKVDLNRNS